MSKNIVYCIVSEIMDENYITLLRQLLAVGSMTQSQLAKRLGITYAALSRWLHGHAKPQPRRMVEIRNLFKELVGYPGVTQARIHKALRRANRLRIGNLWRLIRDHRALQDALVLEHTYNSTSIEGTTFRKRETEAILFDKALIPDKSLLEHLEVTNHASVLRGIFRKKFAGPVTEKFIQGLHHDLMQGVREDAGSYSKYSRAIRGVNIALTHPEDIGEEMENLMHSWNKKNARKTIRDIASFHVQFELIHPFGDGNGRIGRLLMVIQCLQTDYPPVIIENARKADYYEALEYAQRKSDGPFLCFLADQMEKTAGMIRNYLH